MSAATMKKKTVYLFVFDGFADWGPAYALVGINKSKAYAIKTIAIDKSPVKSMGGICIFPDLDFLPDTDLNDIDPSNTAMLILPGGVAWEEKTNEAIAPLVVHFIENRIPVAGICGATVFLADLGVLNTLEHTSNALGYLHAFSSEYHGDAFYQYRPAVSGGQVITASGTAAVEFAAAIFDSLKINMHEAVSNWFQYFEKVTMS
jgi:putative intracellular protease/amidase